MELIIIIALILLNGIFSMSEMSLVSSKKFKLESALKKGKAGAKIAIDLSENPNKFLSTVQIGITLIGILLGVFSGDKLTTDVKLWIEEITPLAPYAGTIASVVVVFLVTYVSIVLGELLPKRLGMTFPENIAMALSGPMRILSWITSPFVWLLTKTNELLLKLLGIKNTDVETVSEEEIKSIIKQSAEIGEIQEIEQDIVERVFELGDTKVDHLLTHRSDITYFTSNDTWEVIKTKIFEHKHSAYPYCEDDDIDKIIGFVTLKDLFTPQFNEKFDITSVLRPVLYINENAYAYTVLEQFKKNRTHYGIVIDEYGSVQGMVTMDDVMDALVGDVQDSDDEEYEIIRRSENSWLVDGQYSLKSFLKEFEIFLDPKAYESYNTVAGLILSQTSELPKVGYKVIIDDYSFEIVDKDGQRIDKIIVEKIN